MSSPRVALRTGENFQCLIQHVRGVLKSLSRSLIRQSIYSNTSKVAVWPERVI